MNGDKATVTVYYRVRRLSYKLTQRNCKRGSNEPQDPCLKAQGYELALSHSAFASPVEPQCSVQCSPIYVLILSRYLTDTVPFFMPLTVINVVAYYFN